MLVSWLVLVTISFKLLKYLVKGFSKKWVPNMFPKFQMCSPRVFLIASGFNPICFAQNPPHLTYIHEPKGKALHLAIESSILGELPEF
jgi:hypothetical protein